MRDSLSIGELGRLTGCRVVTIRYYEGIGILPAPERTAGGTAFTGVHTLKNWLSSERVARLAFPLIPFAAF